RPRRRSRAGPVPPHRTPASRRRPAGAGHVLTLVRHGRTEANRSGLLLGRIDAELDPLGRAQAAAAAEHVGPADRVVCSPLARTRATAAAWGGPVEVDERWIE